MAVRGSMAALIARVRIMINDTSNTPTFTDQNVQDVMDEGRADLVNHTLIARPTYSGSTVQYLDYYDVYGGWEDDLVIKQYLTQAVTPATSEPIAGHWTFAATLLPPLYITGKRFDVYRSAADLLERLKAQWMLSYDVTMDGQTMNRSQVIDNIDKVVKMYRMKQHAGVITTTRSDIAQTPGNAGIGLGPTPIDYFS